MPSVLARCARYGRLRFPKRASECEGRSNRVRGLRALNREMTVGRTQKLVATLQCDPLATCYPVPAYKQVRLHSEYWTVLYKPKSAGIIPLRSKFAAPLV